MLLLLLLFGNSDILIYDDLRMEFKFKKSPFLCNFFFFDFIIMFVFFVTLLYYYFLHSFDFISLLIVVFVFFSPSF